jgi:hypothetical protein
MDNVRRGLSCSRLAFYLGGLEKPFIPEYPLYPLKPSNSGYTHFKAYTLYYTLGSYSPINSQKQRKKQTV